MKIIAIGLLAAATILVPAGSQPPSVLMDGDAYATRDMERIGKALDEFDAQIARRKIDLNKGGWKVELRLVKGDKS